MLDSLEFKKVYTGRKGQRRVAGIKRSSDVERPGVYAIKEDGVIVYVGFSSSNAWRVLYRHFQQWTDRRWYGFGLYIRLSSYEVPMEKDWARYEVALITCRDGRIAQLMERQLICDLNPRDNIQKYIYYMNPELEESMI